MAKIIVLGEVRRRGRALRAGSGGRAQGGDYLVTSLESLFARRLGKGAISAGGGGGEDGRRRLERRRNGEVEVEEEEDENEVGIG